MTYGWAALGFCVLAIGGGLVFAGLRALALWRLVAYVRLDVVWRLTEVGGRAVAFERAAAALPARLDELAAAQARLERSLAHARILQAAARDAFAPLQRLRAAVPRKQQ